MDYLNYLICRGNVVAGNSTKKGFNVSDLIGNVACGAGGFALAAFVVKPFILKK